MLGNAARAFSQIFTPPFRAVLLKSLALTLSLLALSVAGLVALFGAFLALPGWIETVLQVLGGLVLAVGSVFLIAPITSAVAGLYLDDIAAEVERAHYPTDPPGRELPLATSLWLSAKFFVLVVAVNVLALFLLLVPGVNLMAFWIANGYLLGREYFELAAFRHMPVEEARALRRRHAGRAFLAGLVVAVLVSVPLLNLLTPLFAPAFMTHNVKQALRRDQTVLAS